MLLLRLLVLLHRNFQQHRRNNAAVAAGIASVFPFHFIRPRRPHFFALFLPFYFIFFSQETFQEVNFQWLELLAAIGIDLLQEPQSIVKAKRKKKS